MDHIVDPIGEAPAGDPSRNCQLLFELPPAAQQVVHVLVEDLEAAGSGEGCLRLPISAAPEGVPPGSLGSRPSLAMMV